MRPVRTLLAFVAAVVVAFVAAAWFYTQQVIAKQAAIGAEYTHAQKMLAVHENLLGLAPAYGPIVAIALAVGFLVAWGVKKVVRPLAPVAYPVAGFAAIVTTIWLIENVVLGGGVGVIGGARDAGGMALQGAAGALGGLVFALVLGRGPAK